MVPAVRPTRGVMTPSGQRISTAACLGWPRSEWAAEGAALSWLEGGA